METEKTFSIGKIEIRPLYLFLLFLSGFIIFKIPHLSLPFYWDEAWVYGKAVRMMADNGLGMSPEVLPADIGRGHPLLFHNLFAFFLKCTSNTIFSAHLFALIISCLLLLSVFLAGEDLIGKHAGLMASVTLMVQPIFLAQSCLVLPEVLLSFFVILSFWMYLKNKLVLYIIFASAAMLVKESATVIFAAFSFFEFILFLFSKEKNLKRFLIKTAIINCAIIPWFIFLLVQKIQLGYYFFPEHTGYLSFKSADIFDKIHRSFAFIFIHQGRNVLFVPVTVFLIFMLIKRKKNQTEINSSHSKFAGLAASFILLYLLFTSVNFYSDRYNMYCVALFCLAFIFSFFKYLKKNYLKLLILTYIIFAGVISNIQNCTNADHNLGYINAVRLYQKSINYLYKELKTEDTIHAYFNMREDLFSNYPGYIKPGQIVFKNINSQVTDDCRYFILSNVENEYEKEEIQKKFNVILVKRIEEKQAWLELWKKTN